MASERDYAPSSPTESPTDASTEVLPEAAFSEDEATSAEGGAGIGSGLAGEGRGAMSPRLPHPPGPLSPSPDGATLAYLVRDGAGFRLELCPVAGAS